MLVGCSSPSRVEVTPLPHVISEIMRDVLLSHDHAVDSDLGIRFVSVQGDGTTTIQRVDSGDLFEAKPGEFFSGAFGNVGLQLISVSSDQSEIVLRRRWADSR